MTHAIIFDDDCLPEVRMMRHAADVVRRAPNELVVGRPPWTSLLPRSTGHRSTCWLWNAYLWCTILPADLFHLRFPESIGPGSGGRCLAGEDSLFFRDLMRRRNWYLNLPSLVVWHPPRPVDGRKELKYLDGQALTLRALLAYHDTPLLAKLLAAIFVAAFFVRPLMLLARTREKVWWHVVRSRVQALRRVSLRRLRC